MGSQEMFLNKKIYKSIIYWPVGAASVCMYADLTCQTSNPRGKTVVAFKGDRYYRFSSDLPFVFILVWKKRRHIVH